MLYRFLGSGLGSVAAFAKELAFGKFRHKRFVPGIPALGNREQLSALVYVVELQVLVGSTHDAMAAEYALHCFHAAPVSPSPVRCAAFSRCPAH